LGRVKIKKRKVMGWVKTKKCDERLAFKGEPAPLRGGKCKIHIFRVLHQVVFSKLSILKFL
jgi:hypothetical protein